MNAQEEAPMMQCVSELEKYLDNGTICRKESAAANLVALLDTPHGSQSIESMYEDQPVKEALRERE